MSEHLESRIASLKRMVAAQDGTIGSLNSIIKSQNELLKILKGRADLTAALEATVAELREAIIDLKVDASEKDDFWKRDAEFNTLYKKWR